MLAAIPFIVAGTSSPADTLAFALPHEEELQLKEAVEYAKGIYVSPATAPHGQAAKAAKNTLMLTTCNDGWTEMLHSFGCLARELGIKGLVFVQEQTLWERLQRVPMSADEQANSFRTSLTPYFSPTFAEHYKVGTKAATFKKAMFNRAGVLKLHAVLVVLRLGVNVWLSDMDVAFIRNPWPAWNLALPCDMDMIAYFHTEISSSESFKDFSTGFFRARANWLTMSFLEEAIDLSAKKPREVEQVLANIVFQKWRSLNRTLLLQQSDASDNMHDPAAPSKERPLRWCSVNAKCTHPNGLLRLSADQVNEWRNLPPEQVTSTGPPTVFHPNFLIGVGSKLTVLNNSGLWTTYSSSGGCQRSGGLGAQVDLTPRFGATWRWPGSCGVARSPPPGPGPAPQARVARSSSPVSALEARVAADSVTSRAAQATLATVGLPPLCNNKFYAFDFGTFEQAFPGLRSCAFTTYSHVIDEVTRLLPQPCRAQTPAEADFIFPPPYFFHDHNWPIYCKVMDRDMNAAYRDDKSRDLNLSPFVDESSDLASQEWKIDVKGPRFSGSSRDKRCKIPRATRPRDGPSDSATSCVHSWWTQVWPQRYTHAAFPAIEDMLLNVSAWQQLFGVDLASSAKLVVMHHAQTPIAGLVEWEQYPLPASVYQAPHVVWAKISSRTRYHMNVTTRNAGVYRYGLDISLPPSAQAVAAQLAKLPLQPMAEKPFLMGFLGNLVYGRSHIRSRIKHMHNGKDIQILSTRGATSNPVQSYAEFMMNTSFALILRGDTRQTHRMIDCICAGGIPVLLTDFMVPPFNETLPWETFGILINESNWAETERILRAVPMDRREHLQRAARHVCLTAFVTAPRQVQHVIDTVAARPGSSLGGAATLRQEQATRGAGLAMRRAGPAMHGAGPASRRAGY